MTTTVMTPDQAWKTTLSELELQMTRQTFNTWLKDTALVQVEGENTYHIGVRNGYAQDWLANRLADTIARTLASVVGHQVQMKFVVADDGPAPEVNGRAQQPVPGLDASRYSGDELKEIERSLKRKQKKNDAGELPPDVTPDDEVIDRILAPVEDDLIATGFLIVPHYTVRFWKPYLGNVAFDTLLVLSSYWNEQGQDDDPDPDEAGFTIADLERMVGASRHAILGRNARAGRNPIVGGVEVLERENLMLHFVTGTEDGNKMRHHFMIRPLYRLPLLTKKQVSTLPRRMQKEHEKYLVRKKRHIDIAAWEADERQTRVPALE